MTRENTVAPDLTAHLGQHLVHGKATTIVSNDPLTVSTPPMQWAYALSYKLKPELLSADEALTSTLKSRFEVSVAAGCIGIGWTNPEDTAFIEERYASGERSRIAFTLASGTRVGRLMFRNAAAGGIPSVFSIVRAHTEIVANCGRTYPVSIGARRVVHEPIPDAGGTNVVFDSDAALDINAARVGDRKSGV